jgi:hypothetical protein
VGVEVRVYVAVGGTAVLVGVRVNVAVGKGVFDAVAVKVAVGGSAVLDGVRVNVAVGKGVFDAVAV